MHDGLLYRTFRGLLGTLRRAGVPPVAQLPARDADGYAVAIAYMLRARAWTLVRREPRWTELEPLWARAEEQPGVRDGIAGTLSGVDAVRLFRSGSEGFEARDALYAGAARSIDIATYYIQSDDTGRATVRALAACAARGVRVRLLVDRYMMFRKTVEVEGMARLEDDIRAAGIELKAWHDPARPFDSNHRKMIVVDGRRALVGGRNFANHYRGDAWREVDLVLEGPAVAPLARVFGALWEGEAESRGRGAVAVGDTSPWVESTPTGARVDPIVRFVLSAIGAAQCSVDMELAYFVAHDSICAALSRAARRGVRIRVLTNSAEANDLPYANWTAHEGMRRVLEAGGAVHARRGAGRTLHPKYVVVDGEWVSFGSHNMNYYSPRYCGELNLVVRDARLAGMLLELFEAGVVESPALGLDEVRLWLGSHRAQRLFDRAFRDFQ